jgi:hypothetical protein
MENKRILVIADSLHATPRIQEIMKHLVEFGWKITVVSPEPFPCKNLDQVLIQHESFENILEKLPNSEKYSGFQGRLQKYFPFLNHSTTNFISRQIKSLIFIPDRHNKWRRRVCKQVKDIQSHGPFELILSSSSPVSAHLIGRFFAKKWDLPWVADLRDLWSDNHNYPFSGWRLFLDKKIERFVLKDAKVIVTVNNSWVKILERKFEQPIFCIENACKFSKRDSYQHQIHKIRLSSLGPIYPGDHNLKQLLSLLIGIQAQIDAHISFDIYGDLDATNKRLIETYQPSDLEINFFNRVSHEESWRIQCNSDILVLFTWETDFYSEGHIPLRSYEFLASGRPIIIMSDYRTELRNLQFFGKSAHVVSDIEGLKGLFQSIESKFLLSSSGGSDVVPNELTYMDRAHKFEFLFDNLIKGS